MSAISPGSTPDGAGAPHTVEVEADGARMSFLEHLMELRTRLIAAVKVYVVVFSLCLWKSEQLIGIISRPLDKAWRSAGLKDAPELHGALAEPFTVSMRVALYGGLFLGSPAIFYQLWKFIAPGLYKRERRMTVGFVTFATMLFVTGACFAYYIALPMAFRYFFTLHTPIPGTTMRIAPMQMLGDYFDFVLQSLVIFGVSFELPLILLFLGIVGLVDYVQLWRFGRYFILIAFTVGAIFSPPDVVSQVLVSVPLCLLYFVSIFLVYLFGTKKPANGKAGPGARKPATDTASAKRQ